MIKDKLTQEKLERKTKALLLKLDKEKQQIRESKYYKDSFILL